MARACAMAGLDVSGGRLLDEPVAAFIDYAYRYDSALLDGVTAKKNLLVFDFGGGTCDIIIYANGTVVHTAVLPIGGADWATGTIISPRIVMRFLP